MKRVFRLAFYGLGVEGTGWHFGDLSCHIVGNDSTSVSPLWNLAARYNAYTVVIMERTLTTISACKSTDRKSVV